MSLRFSTCWGWFLGMAMSSAYISFTNNAIAQITPDSSLSNNSRVTSSGNTSIIEGGTQAGGNLFHSFQQFSIPTRNTAYFNNTSEIRNIISRVTGGSISNIDGTIRANTANLFLINPNGIIFGQNARLNIGGSFLATTASSLKFADNFEFSATNPQSTPLLTISVPIGLQFPTNPGRITVQGDSQGISGLQVPSNQTLALVGGDISLEGATLKTAGGRIELGSVTGTGFVSLTSINKGFSLGYGAVQNGNIQLSQQASVDASGEGGGDIQVWGRRVTLTDGSQIKANTQGTERGGALVVNAQESVKLIGISPNGSPSGLFTQSDVGATEAAGNVTINTHQLLVQNGAQVSASTFGAGKGGNLAVNADSVQVIGTSSPDNQFLSGLFTQVVPTTIGRVLTATGAGGNVTINTHDLLIKNGGQIQAATQSAGNAGNLTVNADRVLLVGTVTTSVGERGSGLVTSTNQDATGAAGNVIINTQYLIAQDGARVDVRSRGKGNAGNLTVNARSIYLNNNATLNADTTSISTPANQEQATINIRSRDLILRRSNITTKATGSQVVGGNINIDSDVLTTIENSTISADSASFRGGQVKIFSEGIFRSPDTRITATGANPELSGTVQINASDIDPSRGLVQLPTRVVDASTKIVSGCTALASNQNSEFVVTGRGGLPPNPYEPLSGDVLWSDTRFSAPTAQELRDKKPAVGIKHPSDSETAALVPATGWVLNNKGEVTLISKAPHVTPLVSTSASCLNP